MQEHDSTRLHAGLVTVLLLAALSVPTSALGWAGAVHSELGDDIGQAFSPEILQSNGVPGYPYITRTPGPPPDLRRFAVIPEMDEIDYGVAEGGDPNDPDSTWVWYRIREIVLHNSREEDGYDLVSDWGARGWAPGPYVDSTVTHFWDADVSVMNTVMSGLGDTYPNAWVKAKIIWNWAIDAWAEARRANRTTGTAWMYFAHVLHLVVDQGIPCHAHDDWHAPILGEEDTLEDWLWDCGGSLRLRYSWANRTRVIQCGDDIPTLRGDPWPEPPGSFPLLPSNDDVIAVLSGAGGWMDDPELLDAGNAKVRNLQRLFFLMYTLNQYGDFSPSDDVDGDSTDVLHWANFWDGIIQWTNPTTYLPLTDGGSMGTIAVNDDDDDDTYGNLSLIQDVGYRHAWLVAPVLVDLFRKTVDDAPPVSDVVPTRADGAPMAEWNNSAVAVRITQATTDYGRAELGMPPSGVWKLWGQIQGPEGDLGPPTEQPDDSITWTLSADGIYRVRPMSTDKMGNVETQDSDFDVRVDQTPPEVSVPDLRPNYLTSEDFVPLWTATDATSGIPEDGESAYLDGQLVPKGVPIDLSLMAGRHTLEVNVSDRAGNVTYVSYPFEVWIDTATSALPIVVNSKSGGEGLLVYVEFPAPYDVGAIQLDTCFLRPGGTIDLTAPFPVVGGYYGNVPGELLGGIADRDKDGLPERLIRFDRGRFLEAFGGVTGDVPAVVWGGLEPDGMPEFLGAVTVSVFTPPPK
jgi:hypothetical protein